MGSGAYISIHAAFCSDLGFLFYACQAQLPQHFGYKQKAIRMKMKRKVSTTTRIIVSVGSDGSPPEGAPKGVAVLTLGAEDSLASRTAVAVFLAAMLFVPVMEGDDAFDILNVPKMLD
jgi:hypothetical protein